VFDGLLKFFRTPKGLLIIVFAVLLTLTVPFEGARLVAPGLAARHADGRPRRRTRFCVGGPAGGSFRAARC
jgi:hypothetical protein